MIKRNKIIMIIAILLISSSMALIFILREGRVSALEMELNEERLPPDHSSTKKNNEGFVSELSNDSLYKRLSNHRTKEDGQVLHHKDSLVPLSD